MFIIVRRDYCSWCDRYEWELSNNAELSKYIENQFIPIKYDPVLDDGLLKEQIKAFPTTIVSNSYGKTLLQFEGYRKPNNIHKQLQQIIKPEILWRKYIEGRKEAVDKKLPIFLVLVSGDDCDYAWYVKYKSFLSKNTNLVRFINKNMIPISLTYDDGKTLENLLINGTGPGWPITYICTFNGKILKSLPGMQDPNQLLQQLPNILTNKGKNEGNGIRSVPLENVEILQGIKK